MSAYLDWHVGMKVAYVGGNVIGKRRAGWRRVFGSWDALPTLLVVGGVYEVKRIDCGRSASSGEVEVGIAISPDPHSSLDGLYPACCFRKVQERKTDISIFTALLNPSENDKHLIEVHDFVSLQEPFQ